MPSLKQIVRALTKRRGALPDFLIIGAMKCGTTSLYRYLASHPQVARSRPKEIHFFDDHFDRGVKWYRTHFQRPGAPRDGSIRWGEASPYYIFHEPAPQRVASVLPRAKLIALLRDPVARAYSHYQHMHRHGNDDRPFDEAIDAELRHWVSGGREPLSTRRDVAFAQRRYHYIGRGLYADQLERWFRWFDRRQFLILRSEDMFEDPAAIYEQTLRFLDLPPFVPAQFDRRNVGGYAEPMDDATRQRLAAFFAPHNRRLEQLLELPMNWYDGATAAASTHDQHAAVSAGPPSNV